MTFRRNQRVVCVLSGAGTETASLTSVQSVSKKRVLVEDSSLQYDPQTGREMNPAIPGFSSRLIALDGE